MGRSALFLVLCTFVAWQLSGQTIWKRIIVYNGLTIPVTVSLNDTVMKLSPARFAKFSLKKKGRLSICTTNRKGDTLESFNIQPSDTQGTYVYNVAYGAVLSIWRVNYGLNSISPSHRKSLGARRWQALQADHYFTEPPKSVPPKNRDTTIFVVSAYHEGVENELSYIFEMEEKKHYLMAHTLWEDKNSPQLLGNLDLAASLEDFDEILNRRLKMDPREVAFLRMKQEIAVGEDKANICGLHASMSMQEPSNPDLYYLASRCEPDLLKKLQAYADGHRRWPQHTWLANGAAHYYCSKENWEEVLKCLNTVYKDSPLLKSNVVEEMERIYGFLEGSPLIKYKGLSSYYLDYVRERTESTPSSPLYSYRLLQVGKLEEAIRLAQGSDAYLYKAIVALAAVSSGATAEMENKAITLNPIEDLDANTILYILALALKKGYDLKPYEIAIKKIFRENADHVLSFLELVRHKELNEADSVLYSMIAPSLKGRIALLGVLISGKDAPLKWRSLASKLLFINEKPYLTEK